MGSKEKAGANAPTNSSVTPAEKALVRDLKLAAAPDVNKAFVDTKDACARLLPFHVFSDRQPSYSLKYSQAVAEASMLVSLVKGKLSTESESAHAAASAALARYSRWTDPPPEDESSVDEEAQARRRREEEVETKRETRLGVLMRKVEESREMCSGIFHAREGGNLRGEEHLMVAKWLLEEERRQLGTAQQREAEREALRREALLREAQQKEALIREARERSAQQQAARAAQEAQAAHEAQAAQEAQLLAAREAAARAGDLRASEAPESKAGRALAGAPHWLTGGTPERAGPPKSATRQSEERETTDLLSHFALSQAMSAQEEDAVGGLGLSNPPMSTEDLLSWQEADTPRDMPADWLGGAGLMDLNLDVPVVGDGDPGEGEAPPASASKKRQRVEEDDALLP